MKKSNCDICNECSNLFIQNKNTQLCNNSTNYHTNNKSYCGACNCIENILNISLNCLSDTDICDPEKYQFLFYNKKTKKWINKTINCKYPIITI